MCSTCTYLYLYVPYLYMWVPYMCLPLHVGAIPVPTFTCGCHTFAYLYMWVPYLCPTSPCRVYLPYLQPTLDQLHWAENQ